MEAAILKSLRLGFVFEFSIHFTRKVFALKTFVCQLLLVAEQLFIFVFKKYPIFLWIVGGWAAFNVYI